MRSKIAVITSQSLREPTGASLERLKPECETLLVTYESFAQLPGLYDRYAGEVDGFLVSGQVVQAAIEGAGHDVRKPVMCFQADTAELYRAVLRYVLDHPGGDIGRVLMDFLLPLERGASARAFLQETELPELTERVNRWVRSMALEQLAQVERVIAERIVELWRLGQVDMVICLYSSIVPILEAHGIPYDCPHVEDLHLLDLLNRLQVKIELDKLRRNMPVAISAAPRGRARAVPENMEALGRQLERFLHENLLECVLQERVDCCEVFTTVSVMQYLTDRCRSSKLNSWLEHRLPFPVAVGYGVGSDVNQASFHAQAARKEAEFVGGSFIRNENGALIGPLGTEKALVVECRDRDIRDIGEIARRCGLSTLTIQKVAASMKLAGSNKITTQELAGRFGVTVRNANRILARLVEGGCARVAYVQASTSKGRPVKVYELTLEY